MALEHLMAERSRLRYQLPDELDGDRTFVCTVAELKYFDRMIAFTSGTGQRN